MKRSDPTDEKQASKLRQECSATWGGARLITQDVAFRVTRVVEDGSMGRIPVWEPSPLTEEEELILRGLRSVY